MAIIDALEQKGVSVQSYGTGDAAKKIVSRLVGDLSL
jgi:hypothetical protein